MSLKALGGNGKAIIPQLKVKTWRPEDAILFLKISAINTSDDILDVVDEFLGVPKGYCILSPNREVICLNMDKKSGIMNPDGECQSYHKY